MVGFLAHVAHYGAQCTFGHQAPDNEAAHMPQTEMCYLLRLAVVDIDDGSIVYVIWRVHTYAPHPEMVAFVWSMSGQLNIGCFHHNAGRGKNKKQTKKKKQEEKLKKRKERRQEMRKIQSSHFL